MVDVTTKVPQRQQEKVEQRSGSQHEQRGPHGARRRPEDLTRPTHVRVVATDEKYRRVMKHGITKKGFLPDIGQSVEWPFDSYTRRCIKDGSIKIVEDVSSAAAAAPGAEPPKRERTSGVSRERPPETA